MEEFAKYLGLIVVALPFFLGAAIFMIALPIYAVNLFLEARRYKQFFSGLCMAITGFSLAIAAAFEPNLFYVYGGLVVVGWIVNKIYYPLLASKPPGLHRR